MPEHISGVMATRARRPEISPVGGRETPAPQATRAPSFREAFGFRILAGGKPAGMKKAGRGETSRLALAICSLKPGEWFLWTSKLKNAGTPLSVLRKKLRDAKDPHADFDWHKPMQGEGLIIFRPGGEGEDVD